MPRASKPKPTIRANILDAGVKTKSGRVYPLELVEKMAADINEHPITIEEVSPLERKVKKIPICYSWPEHAMAVSQNAEVEDGKLFADFAIKGNKYGKMLKTVLDANTPERVAFKPVVIGDDAPDGTMTAAKISYVTFEVKPDGPT